MKKVPPFIKNSVDNMHCVNAVFRMVYKYYFGKDISWKEIDKITHAVKGKATWTFPGEMWLVKKGLKVINIEPVDYQKLYKKGVGYLVKICGKQNTEYYLKKSNIASVIKYIPEYLISVKHETRKAGIKEITEYLHNGYMVGAEINSRILNNKEGFSLHFVLIYDFDGNNLILHDPGLPPVKSRKVSVSEFDKCFNYEGSNGAVVVFGK